MIKGKKKKKEILKSSEACRHWLDQIGETRVIKCRFVRSIYASIYGYIRLFISLTTEFNVPSLMPALTLIRIILDT